MKRIISLLCVLALTVGCLFVMVSCGGPNSDPQTAKASLESAGYNVNLYEYAKYTYLSATSGDDYVKIYYYGDAYVAEAEALYAGWQETYAAGEEIADLNGEDMEYEIGLSGTIAYKGTSAAISAAK